MLTKRVLLWPFMLLLTVAFTGCDSNDDDADPADVAGRYGFATLNFETQSPAVPDADVLTYINGQSTELELFNDGDFLLRYTFNNGSSGAASGTFSVTDTRVTLNVDSNDEDEFEALLLDPRVRLDRDNTALTSTSSKSVNLESLDPEFFDTLEDVPGTLTIRLTRR
ncbi:MAG: hypothetical protein AAGI71_02180 [Bacteroidota bacterium]